MAASKKRLCQQRFPDPLKISLQLRKEHSLKSFVVFVDLVKAFDTVNHDLIFLCQKNMISHQ